MSYSSWILDILRCTLRRWGRFWSVRIGIHYRALAVEENGEIAWFWIGSHAEYDRLLRSE
ncbi:MAG: hypothetical protein RSE13_11420 [Planktothrix sp. GU0601_MAG3]|nr:MAG: hypothetical protein RSE13_11420 [Planktothrix sp. GU0601_MAG3]